MANWGLVRPRLFRFCMQAHKCLFALVVKCRGKDALDYGIVG